MSRVFVVQRQMKYDQQRGELAPKFGLEAAEEFGEIVYILSPTASPFSWASVREDMHRVLADFSDDDFFLPTGNPCLMVAAGAIAADYNNGRVKALQWSGKDQRYIVVDMRSIFADLAQGAT